MRRPSVRVLIGGLMVTGAVTVGLGQQPPGPASGPDAPIRLRSATFAPARGEKPSIRPDLTIADYAQGQRGYYLVQFRGPILDEWKADLAATGADVLEYVPDFAFKVRMTPVQAARVDALASVGWVGLFHPAYKLGPGLVRDGRHLYLIRIERGASVAATRSDVLATGAQLVDQSGDILTVAASSAQVDAIARVLDVASVENFLTREKHNEHAAGLIVGTAAANQTGYTGSTQTLAIADTGLGNGVATGAHVALPESRLDAIYNWPGTSNSCADVTNDGAVDVDSGHGTHVALSAVGGGTLGRGAAPDAHLVFQATENWARMKGLCALLYPSGYYLVGIPSDVRQLFQQAYDAGARIHSNSWGSAATGDYTLDSANTDDFIWTHPDVTVTFSAGNSGTDANGDGLIDADSIGSPATAKNVITVGASENDRAGDWACDTALGYTSCAADGGSNAPFTYGATWPANYPANPVKDDSSAGNAEQMAAFSSRGPTDDGRIKPDLVAPGTWILSGYSDRFQQGYDPAPNPQDQLWQYDGWGFPRSADLKYMGGTSMSNPIVAGGAAIVRDYYQKVHAHSASAALVKADLINSAVDLLDENNDGVADNAHPIPNVHEGWGRANVAAAVATHAFVDATVGLGTSGSLGFQYDVAGGVPLKVTLAWTDYPSSGTAAKNLVNDLDLVLIGPGATTYRGNVFSGGWSVSGGSADRTNNVENVYVEAAAAGTWTAEVRGFNVPAGPQPFALVVRGGAVGGSNTAPVAHDLAGATNEDVPLPLTLSGSDAEQCDVAFTIVTAPSHGILGGLSNVACTPGSPNADTATLTYVPNANFSGSDAFTYRVADGINVSNLATVSVTVEPVNDTPVSGNVSISTAGDTPVVVTLNATDVETCELLFSVATGPSHGSLGVVDGQVCVPGSPNHDAAQLTYTPASGFLGGDSFTYRANDGTADGTTATVTVTVGGGAAPMAANKLTSTPSGTPVVVTLSATDADTCELSFTVAGGPSHGSLGGVTAESCVPGSPNGDTGRITYTPNAGYTGTDTFTYTANDGMADSNVATVTITVNASSPIPVADNGTVTTDPGVPVAVTLSGSDTEQCDLAFTVVSAPSGGSTSGLANVACTPGTPNRDTATLTYTPNAGFVGVDYIRFVISDGAYTSNVGTVTVFVGGGTAPVATNTAATTSSGTPAAVTLRATDPDTCELAFSIVGGPAHGSLLGLTAQACAPGSPNSDTSRITYSPNAGYVGTDTFTFKANDGVADSNVATVTVTVNAPNTLPVANDGTATTVQGVSVMVTLSGSDAEQCDLTFTIVGTPAHGSLSGLSGAACTPGAPRLDTAAVTYAPNAGFSGSDSFRFVVSDGTYTSNVATVTITVTPATVHVGDLDRSSVSLGRGSWQGTVTAYVHDDLHAPIAGAIVAAVWTGAYTEAVTCTTDINGQCGFTTAGLRNRDQSATLSVTGIAVDARAYLPADNHDPDGDSNGSAVTVQKP